MAAVVDSGEHKSAEDAHFTSSSGFPLDVNAYDIQLQIGRGAFATVYKAACNTRESDNQVAIKVIELEPPDDQESGVNWDEIQKEASVMRSMQHENVVGCLASFVHKQELWLVMPFLAGGSCADIMKNTPQFNNGFKDEVVLATILRDVLQGIAYCHEDGRIHRDIKAGNILLGEDGVAKLSDFGVSGAIIEGGLKKHGRNTFTGSLLWMAPEVMQQEKGHNRKADIWSLGITALELAHGKPPHSDERPVKIMLTIMQMPPPSCDSYPDEQYKFSAKFKKFVTLCLNKDPTRRPSAPDLLANPFIRTARDSTYISEQVLAHRVAPGPNHPFRLPRSISTRNTEHPQEDAGHQSWDFSDRISLNRFADTNDTGETGESGDTNVGRFVVGDGGEDGEAEQVREDTEEQPAVENVKQVGRFEVTEED